MNRTTTSVVERLDGSANGPPGEAPEANDSRTSLRRCLLDTVIPAIALLSMSVLTITMIVVIVTAVAHTGWLTPPTYVSVDPWSSVYSDSDARQENHQQKLDPAIAGDGSSRPEADAGYVAAQLPE